MDHIRGEKVSFGKGDYHHLDTLPSACRVDANVLSTPKRRGWTGWFAKLAALLLLVAAIGVGSVFIALERGYLDETLTARAEAALSSALGDQFQPEVGSIRLRFSQSWMLAFAAVDVKITHVNSGIVALKTDSITAVLDPVALLRGRLALARAEIGVAEGDLRFLPPGPPIDWKTVRIDSVPEMMAVFYPALDLGIGVLERGATERVIANDLSLRLPQPTALGDRVALSDLDLSRPEDGKFVVNTGIRYGKISPRLKLSIDSANGRADAVHLDVNGIASEPLMMKHSAVTGERRYGLDLPLDLAMTAERDRSLVIKVTAGQGLFYADGDAQPVRGGRALLSYDFKGRKIELADGLIDMGDTVIPLEGGAIDLDRTSEGKPHGFAFEVIANDAVGAAAGSGEQPETFNATAKGFFTPETRELQLDTIGVATTSGTLAGSLHARFVKPSPAVTFSARADTLSVAAVKQLWPFWFGKKARHWIITNMTGGSVRNAEIDVSLAAGRIPEHPEPLVFRDKEMHISFDAEDTSVKFLGEMPRSSMTDGHFLMQDRHIKIDITDGKIPLPSGKVIDGRNGIFDIADISRKPLMATLDIDAAGDASAVAEFASFKPVDAMSRAPFKAGDLTGKVTASIKATFGLDKLHNPPKPDWDVALDLSNVGVKQPVEGRKISDIDGTLAIDTQNAVLKGKADIDGMNFDIAVKEPLDPARKAERQWGIDGKLTGKDVAKLAPSLADHLSGSIGISMERTDEGEKAKLDLTSADLSIPVVGWRKGPGIAATAEFTMTKKGNVTEIRDLDFDGDGFGARGNLSIDSRGLVSAKFSRVKLSNADDFALAISRKSGGYSIDVSGESIDMRPFLDRLKSSDTSLNGGLKTSDTIMATIGRASGYNKETLSSVILKMSTSKGEVSAINFSAVTRSGQAVVINRSGGEIEVTAGDAGAAARFTDFYRNMNGGLLNISLKARKTDSWRGSIDLRNFALVNEARLKSIVSARSGKDGRSLSDAVDTDIDVSSQKFRRGFARILLDGKVVQLENGIVRGDQLGATFQGTLRDNDNRMEMTGTFMPAYGLNSLFGELPLIGTILGNGRDRGLLGITFKLVGPFDQPKMTVNPLSLIAPGVFRNIFEFE